MRQIVLDTETTGLDPTQGHRIIEIGCVEIANRRVTNQIYHHYLQPDRLIESEAGTVHGITDEFLRDKPRFSDIADEFMEFIKEAELIIHNADFDVGFINHELRLLKRGWQSLSQYCQIVDTLKLARKRHPGQKNSLDALCKRYNVDNSRRNMHGALLDAQLLAEVYLSMTGGQDSLLANDTIIAMGEFSTIKRIDTSRAALAIIPPTPEELAAHEYCLTLIDKASGGQCKWRTWQN